MMLVMGGIFAVLWVLALRLGGRPVGQPAP